MLNAYGLNNNNVLTKSQYLFCVGVVILSKGISSRYWVGSALYFNPVSMIGGGHGI